MAPDPVIRLEGVTKRFGGIKALDNVSLAVEPGEVHAVVGGNGAGKSTLMKLLAGIHEPDSGTILLQGQPVRITSPRDAEALGIAMVFQELNLFPTLSVAANVFMCSESTRGGIFLDERTMHARVREVLDQLHVDIDPRTRVESLPIGQQQIVEIARAIHQGTRLVIMDEPNSALNDEESRALFAIIQRLKGNGITVLYVSHRLEDVFAVSDRISVLRDGHYVGTWRAAETTIEEIVTAMVGRRLGELFPPRTPLPADRETVLTVSGMQLQPGVEPVTFAVRRGEVLGFAGLEGAGVQYIFHSLFGLAGKPQPGCSVRYLGREFSRLTPPALIENGWAFIPANRREEGLMLNWPIFKNASLARLRHLVTRTGLFDHKQERSLANQYIGQLAVATDSVEKAVINLSGGNQQKVVLAKWLATEPSLIILNDPTRGIDIGAKRDIYALIRTWADQGYTILFSSSEVEETIGVSDRLLVLYKGRIIREFDAAHATKEEVMRYVLGGEANLPASQGAGAAVAQEA